MTHYMVDFKGSDGFWSAGDRKVIKASNDQEAISEAIKFFSNREFRIRIVKKSGDIIIYNSVDSTS